MTSDADKPTHVDDSAVDYGNAAMDGHDADSETELQALHITIERLKAHLVTKGYGEKAIKRILAGKMVR
jgi:hypothetical protein